MTDYFGTPRDWLRENGYQVGERGRLSAALRMAVEGSGLTFIEAEVIDATEITAKPVERSWRENPYFTQTVQRPSKTLYGFDSDGHKIAFSMCWQCNAHMSLCSCKGGVLAPPYISSTKDKDVRLHSNRHA